MALKGIEISQLAERLNQELVGARLSHLVQYDGSTFLFHLSRGRKLVFVLKSDDPYVYLSKTLPEGSSFSSPFGMTLRKEISSAEIKKISQINGDRVLKFELETVNDVYKTVPCSLIAELIPTKANLVLVDENGVIEGCLRPNSFGDPRPCFRGIQYEPPLQKGSFPVSESHFDYEEYSAMCEGKEPALSMSRKKEKYASLYRFLRTKEKALKRKIKAIDQDEEEAKGHLDDGSYGDFIYMNYDSVDPKQGYMMVEGKKVALDPRRNASRNAEAFYKRAKKAKTTLSEAEENRAKAEKELAEVSQLLATIDLADDAYLSAAAKQYGLDTLEKKGVSSSPLSDSATLPYVVQINGTSYLFGKNARQNDFLSFAYDTSKFHVWMHLKDNHGSHLIVKKDHPSDEEIRIGEELTVLASKQEMGEVMYTLRKNVRRGSVPGQAIVGEYQSAMVKSISPEVKEAFEKAEKIKLS